MGRKPRPVPTASEMKQMNDLWQKVHPRIEEALSRIPAPVSSQAEAKVTVPSREGR